MTFIFSFLSFFIHCLINRFSVDWLEQPSDRVADEVDDNFFVMRRRMVGADCQFGEKSGNPEGLAPDVEGKMQALSQTCSSLDIRVPGPRQGAKLATADEFGTRNKKEVQKGPSSSPPLSLLLAILEAKRENGGTEPLVGKNTAPGLLDAQNPIARNPFLKIPS